MLFVTHDVDPATERNEEFRLSSWFAALYNRVWHSLHHQEGRAAVPSSAH